MSTIYNNPSGYDLDLEYDYQFTAQMDGYSESIELIEHLNLISNQYCIEMGHVSGVAEYEQIGVWGYCATQFRYYGLYDFDYVNQFDYGAWGWYCATASTNVFKAKITTITCSDIDSIIGCMDEQACNYNPDASINDDSCWYPPENYNCSDQFVGLECTSHNQCDDGWFCHSGYSPPDGFGGSQYKERYCVEYYNEYCADNMCGVGDGDCDAGQCDDGICGTNNCEYVGQGFYSQGITPEADCCYKPGCTNNIACNYDDHASQDDGSCTYPIDECHNCDGECICDTDIGCNCGILKDALGVCGGSCLSDSDGDGVCDDIDECVGVFDECGICNGPGKLACWNGELVCDLSECIEIIEGCTDQIACNYNPQSTLSDGSCIYPIVETSVTLLTEGYTYDGPSYIHYTTPSLISTLVQSDLIYNSGIPGQINYQFDNPANAHFFQG